LLLPSHAASSHPCSIQKTISDRLTCITAVRLWTENRSHLSSLTLMPKRGVNRRSWSSAESLPYYPTNSYGNHIGSSSTCGAFYYVVSRFPAEGACSFSGARGDCRAAQYRTLDTICAEMAVVRTIREGQNRVAPITSAEQAAARAASREFLNPSQRAVVEEVLTSRDQIQGLQGLAGSGKTTTLETIR
jgi:hypothetical protein